MTDVDIVVIGAGAAGTFAALSAAGAIADDGTPTPPPGDAPRVLLLDGMAEPGRKILISGGGRCNVTNEVVTADDFITSTTKLVRNALRAFGPADIRRFFTARGVDLHVESLGKVFPDSDRARDVLGALMQHVAEAGITTRFGTPTRDVTRQSDGTWTVDGVSTLTVVLATGGLSVPATGSTGFGLDLLVELGHDLLPRVPALAALHGTVGGDELAGLTVPAILTVETDKGKVLARAGGSLLFTHRGVTGPAALDVSFAVEQALVDNQQFRVVADLWTLTDRKGPLGPFLDDPKLPGCCLASPPPPTSPGQLDAHLHDRAQKAPPMLLGGLPGARLPRRLVAQLLGESAATPLGQLTKSGRRAAAEALTRLDLGITESAGYAKAEVTAGGVPLDQLDRSTLESRRAPGLFVCGEVCDVTGRLGGFNFQWAWTSGFLAGRGAAHHVTGPAGAAS